MARSPSSSNRIKGRQLSPPPLKKASKHGIVTNISRKNKGKVEPNSYSFLRDTVTNTWNGFLEL